MIAEVIEDQLSLNATLPRTLGALFFKPGFLSREYVDGRIQRYVPPFRLYLACSVVFFLLLSFLARSEQRVTVSGKEVLDDSLSVAELIARNDSLRMSAGADSGRAFAGLIIGADTTHAPSARIEGHDLARVHTSWPQLDSLANRKIRELMALPPREAWRQFMGALLQRAPTVIFLMLPCYALLLQLLYFRRRKYYVEHFVFGLHTHAFAFVLFTVILLASRISWLGGPLMLWLICYGYLALRRYYGDGWLSSLFKYAVLGALYSVVLASGLLLTVIAALLLG